MRRISITISTICVGASWRLGWSINKQEHFKNVGSIRHNEPPHANSSDVASGTVARRLRIDVHDNDDNDDDNDNA